MGISTTLAVVDVVNNRRLSLTEPATLDAIAGETSRTNDAICTMFAEMGLPDALQELIILDTNLEVLVNHFAVSEERYERDNKADRRYDELEN